jgi:hypothetical protein
LEIDVVIERGSTSKREGFLCPEPVVGMVDCLGVITGEEDRSERLNAEVFLTLDGIQTPDDFLLAFGGSGGMLATEDFLAVSEASGPMELIANDCSLTLRGRTLDCTRAGTLGITGADLSDKGDASFTFLGSSCGFVDTARPKISRFFTLRSAWRRTFSCAGVTSSLV